jgi:hypothetical protein
MQRAHDGDISRKQTGAPSWFTVSCEKVGVKR